MTTWLTTGEVARQYGYDYDTIRRRCEKGVYPNAHRNGPGGHWRIPRADVEAHIEAMRPRKRAARNG